MKPIVDVVWFTYQTYLLLGSRNTAYLYIYMIAGLGLLRVITPNFAKLVAKSQELEGIYRLSYCDCIIPTHLDTFTRASAHTLSLLPFLEGVLVRAPSLLTSSSDFSATILSWFVCVCVFVRVCVCVYVLASE